jgi:CBS domain-containing protein/Flp pilus assembly pilin Flp
MYARGQGVVGETRQTMRELKTAAIVRACRKFAAGAGGSAAVEYAAILTMVAGLSYVGYSLLGAPVERALSQVAQSTPSAREAASKNAGRESSASAPLETGDSSAATDAPASPSFAWLPASALLLTLLAAGALVLDRRRRGDRLVELQESSLPSSLRANFVEKRQQILRVLTGRARRHPGECVTVRHLMTTRLTTVDTSTTIEEICRLMHDTRIRHLLVVRGERELLGIVSDRDVAHRSGRTAEHIMTRNPTTVIPETPAIQAISMMLGGRFSCVPVVEANLLVGLLTSSDVMMALQCTLQILSQSLQSTSADLCEEVKGARYFARLAEAAEEENLAEAANA